MATRGNQSKASLTIRSKQAKAESPIDLDSLFDTLSGSSVREVETKKPKPGLDEEVADIYSHASRHRSVLVWFYIIYTSVFSLYVIAIITLQAYLRARYPDLRDVEIIPQWALYILISGMFGQFIGLLAIVTKKVWTFEPFFKHADTQHKHK